MRWPTRREPDSAGRESWLALRPLARRVRARRRRLSSRYTLLQLRGWKGRKGRQGGQEGRGGRGGGGERGGGGGKAEGGGGAPPPPPAPPSSLPCGAARV